MVRQLMKLIIGENELKEYSPTGKNGWKPIPDNIYEGVERKSQYSGACQWDDSVGVFLTSVIVVNDITVLLVGV